MTFEIEFCKQWEKMEDSFSLYSKLDIENICMQTWAYIMEFNGKFDGLSFRLNPDPDILFIIRKSKQTIYFNIFFEEDIQNIQVAFSLFEDEKSLISTIYSIDKAKVELKAILN